MSPSAASARLPRQPLRLEPLPAEPLVSVLTPNFNYGRYLPETIESVLAQTYSRWELIFCDDGSTDGSYEIVERYARLDPRIKLLRQANAGQAAALNTAYRSCSGTVLCILDADDRFHPTKLARVVERFTERSDTGLLVHAMTLVDGDGKALYRIPILGAFEEGWIAERVRQRGGRWRYMPSSALVFRRELAKIGFPIPARPLRVGADGFLFTLFPLFTKTTYLPEELSAYRIHGSNICGRLGVDAAAARSGAALMTQIVEAVNERLAEMELTESLRVRDNLHISLELLVAHLLEGKPRGELVRSYAKAVRDIVADDLYGVRQKLLMPVLFGCATVMPHRWRRGWLNLAISAGALKRAVVRLVTGWTVERTCGAG